MTPLRKLSDQQSIFTYHYHSINMFWPNHVEIPMPLPPQTIWNCSYQIFSLDLNALKWDSTACGKKWHPIFCYLCFLHLDVGSRGSENSCDMSAIEKVCWFTVCIVSFLCRYNFETEIFKHFDAMDQNILYVLKDKDTFILWEKNIFISNSGRSSMGAIRIK